MSYQDPDDGFTRTVFRGSLNGDSTYRSAEVDSHSQPNQQGSIGVAKPLSWPVDPHYSDFSSKIPFSQPTHDTDQIFTTDPPPPSVHLEKTSFSATGNPNDLNGALVEYFANISQSRVDCDHRAAKCRIVAILYHVDHEICKFRINFYREKKKHEKEAALTIVEFQRLTGSTISFGSFYFELLKWPRLRDLIPSLSRNKSGNSSIGNLRLSDSTHNVGSSPSLFPLPIGLGASSGDESKTSLEVPAFFGLSYDEDTVIYLCDMATSEDLGSQRESARSLANLSMNDQAKPKMAKLQGIITALGVLLKSPDYQTARNAACTVANLVNGAAETFKSLVGTHLLTYLKDISNEPKSLSTRDLKRQVEKILQLVK